jgi:formiminotetrahydrofolate cyclodeaminase
MDTLRAAHESLESFLARLASDQPAPGGGAAAALAGATAAALVAMACRVTARHAPSDTVVVTAIERADALRARLLGLMDEDVAAYEEFLRSRRASRDQSAAHEQSALQRATVVPVDVARASASVLELCASVVDRVRASTVGDLAVAAKLSTAAVQGSTFTARINLRDMTDRQFAEMTTQQLEALAARNVGEREGITRRVNARTGLENLV